MTSSIYHIDGPDFVPGLASRATWYADAQHGGPVAALIGRQIESTPSVVPMMVNRLTVELMRPIPVRPMRVEVRVVRDGKRIQMLEATVQQDGTLMARATALRTRIGDVPIPGYARRTPPPGPGSCDPTALEPAGEPYFHTIGIEVRPVQGSFYDHGPAEAWFRLAVPLVDGEDPSPLQRTLAVADFGNGVSRVLDRGYVFMNADLSVHLHRLPAGEWVCLASRSDAESSGVGLAQSELYDEHGPIGHALQSLFIESRDRFGG